MTDPVVSVIIPVCEPAAGLVECLESIAAQTIGPDLIETIAVDDGCGDQVAAALHTHAARLPGMRVIHLPGGDEQPCNAGLTAARAEYVMFLNPEDRLDRRALERMCAMAHAARSDIVVGRIAAADGSTDDHRLWRTDQADVDLFGSGVYDFLERSKLFRRRFLVDGGLRFPRGWGQATDQPFVAAAYLNASIVSVVAEADCVITDTTRFKPPDPVEFLARIDSVAEMIAAHIRPGSRRDQLLARHVRKEVLEWTVAGAWLDDLTGARRRAIVASAKAFIDRWVTLALFDRLPAVHRVMAYCLQHNKLDDLTDVVRHHLFGPVQRATVFDGHLYAGLPLFRNPAAGIPDRCYDITNEVTVAHQLHDVTWCDDRVELTGHAFIPHVDTDGQTITVVVREPRLGTEYRIPARLTPTPRLSGRFHDGQYDYGRAGFTALLDLRRIAGGTTIPDGHWTVSVEVRAHGLQARRPVDDRSTARSVTGHHRLVALPGTPKIIGCARDTAGALCLDVTEVGTSPAELVRLTGTNTQRTAMTVTARGDLAGWPGESVAELCLVRGTTTRTIPASISPDGTGFDLTAAVPSPRLALAPGWWGLGVRLSWPGGRWEVPVRDVTGDQVWLRGRPSMKDVWGRTVADVRA